MKTMIVKTIILVSALTLGAACQSEQPPQPLQGWPQAVPQMPGQPVPGYPQPQPTPGYPQAQPVPGYPQGQAAPGYPQAQAQQPAQPAAAGQPAANPLGALFGALGAMAQAGQQQPGQAGGQPVRLVSAQELMATLPLNAPGWTREGEPEFESVEGLSSEARCRLVQGQLRAKVQIVDTAFNTMLAMAFPMARLARTDSSTERTGPIDFGAAREYPGVQTYRKGSREAEVTILVKNRLLVTVTVDGAADEQPAVALASQVNLPRLAQLVGP